MLQFTRRLLTRWVVKVGTRVNYHIVTSYPTSDWVAPLSKSITLKLQQLVQSPILNKKHIVQLVETSTEVVMCQRHTDNEDLNYFRRIVWDVKDGYHLFVAKTSNYSHPYKFFLAHPDDTVVHLYEGILHEDILDSTEPKWTGLIQDVEAVLESGIVSKGLWEAVDPSRNWLGTSEY